MYVSYIMTIQFRYTFTEVINEKQKQSLYRLTLEYFTRRRVREKKEMKKKRKYI